MLHKNNSFKIYSVAPTFKSLYFILLDHLLMLYSGAVMLFISNNDDRLSHLVSTSPEFKAYYNIASFYKE